MKQKPETRPNKEVLNQFIGWSKALSKSVEECVLEAIELYDSRKNDFSDSDFEYAAGIQNWKTFKFEIDLLEWAEFKYKARENDHERDVALTIAMAYFNEKYTKKLTESL